MAFKFDGNEITVVNDVRSSGIDTIVPFGKFKGHPVSAMLSDTQYVEWLSSQPWFKEKYGNIYNVVFNVVPTTVDSPEHNEMQAAFLDPDRRVALAVMLEADKLSDMIRNGSHHYKYNVESVNDTVNELDGKGTTCLFEEEGWDVVICSNMWLFLIEIKPDIGDDLTAVLREIRTRMTRKLGSYEHHVDEKVPVLVYRRYNGSTVTEQQFRSMFESSGVRVVSESDIPDQTVVMGVIRRAKDDMRKRVEEIVRPGDTFETRSYLVKDGHYVYRRDEGYEYATVATRYVVDRIECYDVVLKNDLGEEKKLCYREVVDPEYRGRDHGYEWRKVNRRTTAETPSEKGEAE